MCGIVIILPFLTFKFSVWVPRAGWLDCLFIYYIIRTFMLYYGSSFLSTTLDYQIVTMIPKQRWTTILIFLLTVNLYLVENWYYRDRKFLTSTSCWTTVLLDILKCWYSLWWLMMVLLVLQLDFQICCMISFMLLLLFWFNLDFFFMTVWISTTNWILL